MKRCESKHTLLRLDPGPGKGTSISVTVCLGQGMEDDRVMLTLKLPCWLVKELSEIARRACVPLSTVVRVALLLFVKGGLDASLVSTAACCEGEPAHSNDSSV